MMLLKLGRLLAVGLKSSKAPCWRSATTAAAAIPVFLRHRILANGPISVAEYMQTCLTGYYNQPEASDTVIGEKADFLTSPEISQMFGELVGVWIAHELGNMGVDPRAPWQLVELGPGRGTLASDLCSILKRFGMTSLLSVHLVEISESFAQNQELALCGTRTNGEDGSDESKWYRRNVTNFGTPIYWYRSIKDVPASFSIFIAHEFFDALPVHCFKRTEKGWSEVCVDLDEDSGLRFSLSSKETVGMRAFLPPHIRNNSAIYGYEVSPKSGEIVEALSRRINENGGAALIVDYGHDGERDWTLRAYKRHQLVHPLTEPGAVDLTADVNFACIREQTEAYCCCFGAVPQADFLRNLGLDIRFHALLKKCETEEQRAYLRRSYHVMTDSNEMGHRFKAFSMFPKVLRPVFDVRKAPVGFLSLQ